MLIAYFPKRVASQFVFSGTSVRTNYVLSPALSPSEIIYNNRHPANKTQKPVELLKHLLENHTHPTDVIIDLFSGTGSTAEAALRLGRSVVSFEKDESQVACANIRLRKVTEELQTAKTASQSTPKTTTPVDPPSTPEQNCASCGMFENEEKTFAEPCAICSDIVHHCCLPEHFPQPEEVTTCSYACYVKWQASKKSELTAEPTEEQLVTAYFQDNEPVENPSQQV